MKSIAQAEVDAIARNIAAHLTIAWNDANGEKFAAAFMEDAVFVNVYGEVLRTRVAISSGHQYLFAHAFKGVKNYYELIEANQIDDHTLLSHNKAVMPGKEGGLTMTLVITEQAGQWLIRALQNTITSNNPFTRTNLIDRP